MQSALHRDPLTPALSPLTGGEGEEASSRCRLRCIENPLTPALSPFQGARGKVVGV